MSRAFIFVSLVSVLPLVALVQTDVSWLWLVSTLLLGFSLVLFNIRYTGSRYRLLLTLCFTSILQLVNVSYFMSFMLQNEGFNTAFFYHIRPDVFLSSISDFALVIVLGFNHAAALIASAVLLASKSYPNKSVLQHGALVTLLGLMGVTLWSPLGSGYAYITTHIFDNSVDATSASLILEKVKNEKLRFSGDKRPNLVVIYTEGLEKTFFELPEYPDLMPNLKKIKRNSYDFTDMVEVDGTDFTMGGVVASQCGLPIVSPYKTSDNNANAPSEDFMIGARCLSDILKGKGYQQSFLGGADLRFAGKGKFFRSHHYDSVQGKQELINKLDDPKDVQGWGLWDEDLFRIGRENFHSLAEQDQPFMLTMLTVDTHPPHGNKSKSCDTYAGSENKMLISVHCADQLVSDYIEMIRSSKYSENTVIVVMSDHLMMHSDASKIIKKSGVPRRLSFFINFHDGRNAEFSESGTHFDIAATIMDALGFKQEGQFGFGRSLLQNSGFLHSEAESLDVVNNTLLKEYVASLWFENPVVLDHRGVEITRITSHTYGENGHRLKIGDGDYNLTYQGIWDTAETLLRFNSKTLELVDYQTYFGNHQGMDTGDLAQMALESPDDNYIIIGRNKFLRGLVNSEKEQNISIFIGSPSGENNFVEDIHKKPLIVSLGRVIEAFEAPKSISALKRVQENAYPVGYMQQERDLKSWFVSSAGTLKLKACSNWKCESEIVDGSERVIPIKRGVGVYAINSDFSSEHITHLDYCDSKDVYENAVPLPEVLKKQKSSAKYLALVSYDSVHCSHDNQGEMEGVDKWVGDIKLPKFKNIKFRRPYVALIDTETNNVIEAMTIETAKSSLSIEVHNGEAKVSGF